MSAEQFSTHKTLPPSHKRQNVNHIRSMYTAYLIFMVAKINDVYITAFFFQMKPFKDYSGRGAEAGKNNGHCTQASH
jgi:hypothetical protein